MVGTATKRGRHGSGHRRGWICSCFGATDLGMLFFFLRRMDGPGGMIIDKRKRSGRWDLIEEVSQSRLESMFFHSDVLALLREHAENLVESASADHL